MNVIAGSIVILCTASLKSINPLSLTYEPRNLGKLPDDPDIRRTLFLRAVRFLAAKGEAFDWLGAASWLLASNDKREEAARRIARDFYATQSRIENNAKE